MMITSSKYLICKGDDIMMTQHYELMSKRSRAGKNGKNIKCPHCHSVHKIYHLSWSSLTCNHCQNDVDKYDWLIDQLDTWRTPK